MPKKGSRKVIEDDEVKRMRMELYTTVGSFIHAWSDLEEHLFTLFWCLTNAPREIASGIFYSTQAFDAQVNMIDRVFKSASEYAGKEGDVLRFIAACWEKTERRIDGLKRLRNMVAHGKPHFIKDIVDGEFRVKQMYWAPSQANIVALQRRMAKSFHPEKGINTVAASANDMRNNIRALHRQMDAVAEMNRLLYTIYNDADVTDEQWTAWMAKLKEIANVDVELPEDFFVEVPPPETAEDQPSEIETEK